MDRRRSKRQALIDLSASLKKEIEMLENRVEKIRLRRIDILNEIIQSDMDRFKKNVEIELRDIYQPNPNPKLKLVVDNDE